jgi:signal transduction histidine kinase
MSVLECSRSIQGSGFGRVAVPRIAQKVVLWFSLILIVAIASGSTSAAKLGIAASTFPAEQFVLEQTASTNMTSLMSLPTVGILLVLALSLAVGLASSKGRLRAVDDISQAERERIARDIHDTLLQGMMALLFRLQMWEENPNLPDSLRKEIRKVVQQTDTIVTQTRERILMLRSPNALAADLPEALGGGESP